MLKLIFKYLKKYWYLAILAPLFMVAEVAMDFVLSKYLELMIDNGIQIISAENMALAQANILKYGLDMVIVVLIGVVCGVLSGVFTNLATYKAVNDLRKDLFNKIMNLSYDQTDKFSTGSLVIRVTNDITQIQQMISMSLRMLIRQIAMFVLGIVFTLSIDKRFGYVLMVVIPLELLIMFIFLKKGTPLFGLMQTKIDKVNTVVHENLSGARVVKAFNKEDYEIDRFEKANTEQTNILYKVNKLFALAMPLIMVFVYVAQTVIYAIGGSSIIEASKSLMMPELLVGQVNQAITYIMMIIMSLMMFGMLALFITRAMASAKRINEVLNCPLEIADGNFDCSTIKDENKGTIDFKGVSFRYPCTNSDVLNDLNFSITKGETVAIVGGTGSGKTSIVNLITRFYDVTNGELLVDGVNVKDYKLYDLRQKVAICLQKSELFAGTIEDNVKWGKQDASREEVIEACEIAQAMEFVNSRKKGLDEWVEEKGTSLSGGQKQRLSIARAIIKKPEIIIFDDSTSALDLVTESNLYKAMSEKIKHVTKIVVAQRIATAKKADKIIVLDQGRIVDFDTHENLMKRCNTYIDIYNSQLKDGDING